MKNSTKQERYAEIKIYRNGRASEFKSIPLTTNEENEIKVLKGCPDKLYSIIPKVKNDLSEYSLHKTLSEILNFKSL